MQDERALYDRLWDDALASFRSGAVELDPHLPDRVDDDRLGLTLAARFDDATRERLSALLDDLRALAPEQHIYRPDELHITVLSVVTTTPGFDPARAPLGAYRALFAEVFAAAEPLTLHLRGLTASRCCVMLCGYSADGALNVLRAKLREALSAAGLQDGLELRYRITAAHATLLRFQTPPARLDALIEGIAARRDIDYGACHVDAIEFVLNDWYMSNDRVRVLARFPLGGLGPE